MSTLGMFSTSGIYHDACGSISEGGYHEYIGVFNIN